MDKRISQEVDASCLGNEWKVNGILNNIYLFIFINTYSLNTFLCFSWRQTREKNFRSNLYESKYVRLEYLNNVDLTAVSLLIYDKIK